MSSVNKRINDHAGNNGEQVPDEERHTQVSVTAVPTEYAAH